MKALVDILILAMAIYLGTLVFLGSTVAIFPFFLCVAYLAIDSIKEMQSVASRVGWIAQRASLAVIPLVIRRITNGRWF